MFRHTAPDLAGLSKVAPILLMGGDMGLTQAPGFRESNFAEPGFTGMPHRAVNGVLEDDVMTLTMWMALIAAVGMATLVVTVFRARHPLATPLGLLIATLLVWNLSWLAFVLSGDPRWRWGYQITSSLVSMFGVEFVLVFVGRQRELAKVRRAVHIAAGVTTAMVVARFLVSDDALYVGHSTWWPMTAGMWAAASMLSGGLLIHHYRVSAEPAERAATRLLMIGFATWTVLATTDLVHRRFDSVPRMSSIGMLLCCIAMAVVMDRLRSTGPSPWLMRYAVLLFAIALTGHVLVFRAFPVSTAMLFARTLILLVVGFAAARELFEIMSRRRQRMTELALIGRVTAQMAHDLKNPLSAIRCAAQIMEEEQRRAPAEADPRQQRMLMLITEQSRKLANIVDDYRRVGRMEPLCRDEALAGIVAQIACSEHVELDVQLSAGLRCRVDRDLLVRALDNLVCNAADAMQLGGKVRITAEQHCDRWVELHVVDNGCGMDARIRERAFDDFYTTKAKGSGLGLAFVRRVAETHGGQVSLVSSVGAGTCVVLRLPSSHPSHSSHPLHHRLIAA